MTSSVACGLGSSPVPDGYPAVGGSGAAFDLVVDGVARHDSGGNGAYFVDDAVVAKQHYQIAGQDTILTVPSLDYGTYSLPDANGNVGFIYDNGGFYDARTRLQISIDGRDGSYVWGSLDGLLTDSFAVTTQPDFPVSGTFAARIR